MSEPPREGKAPLPAFPTQVKLCVKILALLNSSGRWLSPAVLHVPRAPPFAWWGWEAAYSPLLLAVGIWAGLLQGGPGADRSPPHPGGSSQASCPISTRQGEPHRHKTWLHVRSLLSLPMLTHCWALSPAPAFPTPSSTELLGLHCHCCSFAARGVCAIPSSCRHGTRASPTARGSQRSFTSRVPSKIDVKRKRPPKKTPPWDHLLLRVCSLFHSLFPLSSAFPTAFLTCLPLNIDFVWEAKPACLIFFLGSVPCSSHRLPTALGGSSLGQHRRWSPSPSISPCFDQKEIHL